MTSNELEGIWADDLLERRHDASFLEPFLINRLDDRGAAGKPRSFVLNIDAGWGRGKSFFLERFARQLRAENYLVAEVNAWRDDHADDPLLAVMAAIDDAVSPALGKRQAVRRTWKSVKESGARIAIATVRGAAIHWTRKGLGDGANVLIESLSGESDNPEIIESLAAGQEAAVEEFGDILEKHADRILERFREEKRTIELFRKGLAGFLGELAKGKHKTPLFVLVDELDRCRPPYAIKLLERVKHLFEIDNIIFVIATDTSQLQHSIKAVYGTDFDSPKYLRRFFDRTYVFPAPSFESFVRSLLRQSPLAKEKVSLPFGEDKEDFIVSAFSRFDLTPRDVEQAYDLLRTVVTMWETGVKLELAVLLPQIIGYQKHITPSLTEAFANTMADLEINGAEEGGRWRATQRVAYSDVLMRAAQLGSSPLPTILEGESNGNPVTQWAQRVASEEMQVLHNNRYNPRTPPYSVVRQYPALISMAGHLRL